MELLLRLLGFLLVSAVSAQTTETAQPFDGGAVGSCEVPTVRGQCYGIINYPVPSPIAWSADIIEARVNRIYLSNLNTLSTFNAQGLTPQLQACLDVYRAIMCRIEFPRCQSAKDGPMQVVLNQQDCSELYGVCPRLSRGNQVIDALGRTLAGHLCFRFPNATLPLGGCRPVSELLGNYVPQGCFSDRSMMMPCTLDV